MPLPFHLKQTKGGKKTHFLRRQMVYSCAPMLYGVFVLRQEKNNSTMWRSQRAKVCERLCFVCVRVCMCMCMYIYACACACACTCACACACACVCMCICMCKWVCVYTNLLGIIGEVRQEGTDMPHHFQLPESGIDRVRAGEIVFRVETTSEFRPALFHK